jgi:heme/copper-type cytochrome/quinol oxidase subunit 2
MSSNISGADFSKMNFTVESVGIEDFKTWVTNAKQGEHFTADSYTKLAKPGGAQPTTYHLHDKSIYDSAIMKYMGGHQ